MKERILEILKSCQEPVERYNIVNEEDAAEAIAQLMCDREAKFLYDGFEFFHNKSVADQRLHLFPASLFKQGYSTKQIEKAIEKLK